MAKDYTKAYGVPITEIAAMDNDQFERFMIVNHLFECHFEGIDLTVDDSFAEDAAASERSIGILLDSSTEELQDLHQFFVRLEQER